VSAIVVIGSSLGGLHALEQVLGGLPGDFPVPLLAVQHRAPDGPALLSGLLQRHCALEVCEAEDKAELRAGRVLVAPAGYHVLVEPGHVALSLEAEVALSRPSIDVAFETAARAYGRQAIAIVLTGANDDGARGLAEICRLGGTAIVQDPATARGPQMPAAAIDAVDPRLVLALEEIAPRLAELAAERAQGAPR